MDKTPLIVTVLDPATGETTTREVRPGDYALITCEPCFTHRTDVYPKAGTHVITVKGWTPVPGSEPDRG